MMKKLEVTPAEMLELRAQGMSNHDIAKSLDISVSAVYKYIGSQGGEWSAWRHSLMTSR